MNAAYSTVLASKQMMVSRECREDYCRNSALFIEAPRRLLVGRPGECGHVMRSDADSECVLGALKHKLMGKEEGMGMSSPPLSNMSRRRRSTWPLVRILTPCSRRTGSHPSRVPAQRATRTPGPWKNVVHSRRGSDNSAHGGQMSAARML